MQLVHLPIHAVERCVPRAAGVRRYCPGPPGSGGLGWARRLQAWQMVFIRLLLGGYDWYCVFAVVSSGADRAALRVRVSRRAPAGIIARCPACVTAADGMGAHAMMDIDALRAQTPGCARRIHLNNAGAALLAQPTLDAMTGHLRLEAEIGGYEAAARAREGIAAAYAAIAELVGGRSREVVLFDNATHAWNAAFYSVPLGRADQILTGRAEYGSNVLAYWQAAKRTGAEVAVVPNDRYGQMDLAALAAMADERTRLIGVSHVPTSGGLVQPAAEIGKIARACGALFLLDATQSAGQLPLDVQAIGCDMLTGTGRKFLRGPRGTGFLWVRAAALIGLTRSWPRSDLRPGTGAGASPGPRVPAVSGPGSTATSTSWAWARPCGKPSTWAWPRSPSAPSRWAPGSATSSAGCPVSPLTTWARPAAPSSPPRSRTGPLKKLRQPWGAPQSTSAPPCPRTTRSTPRTAASTP